MSKVSGMHDATLALSLIGACPDMWRTPPPLHYIYSSTDCLIYVLFNEERFVHKRHARLGADFFLNTCMYVYVRVCQ